MKQNPEKKINVLREVGDNKVFPVYLLCGTETFLIEGTLKQVLDKLLSPDTRDFNLTILDGNTVSVRDILSNVELYPTMSDWRVVVVENFSAFKSQKRTTSPLTVVREAMRSESEDVQKCVNAVAKLIGISTQQIADGNTDYDSAIDEISETLGSNVPEDIQAFFKRLPQLASQLDEHQEVRSKNEDTELLLEWLEGDLPDTSVLIFVEKDDVSSNHRIAKAIQKVGRYVSYDPLEKGSSLNKDPLYKKVVEKFATYNKRITPRAFEQLRNRTGGDMHMIAEAINKIINFVGEKQQIDEVDVRNIVSQSTYDRIFDLTDAIGKRSTRQGLKSLREILASGVNSNMIAGAIVSHLRLTLQAKLIAKQKELKPISRQLRYNDFITKIFEPLAEEFGELLPNASEHNILKRNPYPAYKIFQTLHAFTTEELVSAMEKTLEMQIQSRTTHTNDELLLEQLVYEICNDSKPRLS